MRLSPWLPSLALAVAIWLPASTGQASEPASAGAPLAELPPGHLVSFHLTARDVITPIAEGIHMQAWTFDGQVPGPTLHARVGDRVKITFTNRGAMPHSIDFHAARVDWKTAFRSIDPGQSLSFEFQPRYPGAFLYHCGTPPVLLHMGSGMYGAMIVDPLQPLPPAREFVLVYSTFFVTKAGSFWRPDYPRMLANQPDYAAFNGRAFRYRESPLRAHVGERVRFYVVNAGPRGDCAFHVIGLQLDTVYPAAPPAGALHGVQTYAIPPGGGAIVEVEANQKGTFPFVNHNVGHGDQGATGLLVVDD